MLARFALIFLLGGVKLRPYVPPVLDPEPEPTPSAVRVVEIAPTSDDWDATVLARPLFTAPTVGMVLRGAHIAVRGELALPNARGCASHLYYALQPQGWICSSETRPSSEPPTTQQVLQLVEGSSLPYRYVMVIVPEGEFLPMWASLEALHDHEEPERKLGRGDSVALSPRMESFEGESYYVSVDAKVVPVKGTYTMKGFSEWQGVELNASTHFPFAWVNPQKAPVFDAPKGQKIDELEKRTRLDVLEEQTLGKDRWLRVGDGRWMKAGHLNEVRKIERPEGTGTHPQWFDVDLGEQVVVAYVADKPVYATLTSSGREPNHSPRGNYPIWGKATAITMKSQEYDDVQYYVNRVPWVMFFQAHNALHGAYWHDRFGSVKSHGCVNLSPKDSRYLFEWLEPKLPPGWTAIRYWDLTQAPVAHVHDSGKQRDFFQERNVGPPDKADEQKRLDQALLRREAKEREAEAARAAQAGSTPGTVTPGAAAQGASGLTITPSPSAMPALPRPVPLAPLPAPNSAMPKSASSASAPPSRALAPLR